MDKKLKTFDGKLEYHRRVRRIIERLKDSNTSLEDVSLLYADMICDTVDEYEMVKEAASKHLADFEIECDSYGIPSAVDIVETLCKKIDKYKILEWRVSEVTAYDWSDNDEDAFETIEQLRDALDKLERKNG